MGKRVSDIKAELLAKQAVREAYDEMAEEFGLAAALIDARSQAGLSQAAVAARMGTTQSVVARMESGRTLPSSRSLQRYADATGSRLKISFVRG